MEKVYRKSLYPNGKYVPKYGNFNQTSAFQWKCLYPNGKGLFSLIRESCPNTMKYPNEKVVYSSY